MAASNLYRTPRRWHFYAGLFVIPMVLILARLGAPASPLLPLCLPLPGVALAIVLVLDLAFLPRLPRLSRRLGMPARTEVALGTVLAPAAPAAPPPAAARHSRAEPRGTGNHAAHAHGNPREQE